MIADNLNKLENDIKESYNSLNGFDIPENKNTDNLPNTIENAITTLKTYIPSATSENGVCENAVPLNASVEVDGNSEQKTYEGYNLAPINAVEQTLNGITFTPLYENGLLKSIHVKGTATELTLYEMVSWLPKLTTDMYISGIEGGSATTYMLTLRNRTTGNQNSVYNKAKISEIIVNDEPNQLRLRIISGTTVDFYCYPMISIGEKPYEPYTGGQPSPSPEYPQDIEVVDGVNMLDESKYNDGNYYSYSNGKIQLKNKDTRSLSQISENEIITLSKGTYTINLFHNTGYSHSIQFIIKSGDSISNIAGDTGTFTLTQETKMFIKPFIGLPSNAILPFEFNFQITKGTEPKPYLPYGHIGLLQRGKNLFDKDNVNKLNGYVNSSNVITNLDTARTIYIECKPNTTYTIQKNNNGENNRFCVFTTNKIPTVGDSVLNYVGIRKGENNVEHLTITTPSNATYLNVFYGVEKTTPTNEEQLANLQIEESSTPTPYEPYHEPILHGIDLAGNSIAKVGDVKDLLSISEKGVVELEKKIEKYVLNSNNNWSKTGTNVDRYYLNFGAITDYDKENFSNISSNYFVKSDSGERVGSMASNNQGFIGFAFSSKNESSLNDWKNWLDNHLLELYYQLKTPQKLTLPTTEPIKMWEGTNIFELITNLDTTYRIKYYIDKNAIMNKILELGGGI